MKTSKSPSPFELAPLPWKNDALAPLVSANTIRFHFGKHHKGYVDNLNRLVAGDPLSELSLEQLVRKTANVESQSAIFNNAAQAAGKTCLLAIDVWEHAYYLDYRNRRADFVAAVIEHLLHWELVAERFAVAESRDRVG
jgi:Fe-Mn family superoxide dismutase